MMAKNWGLPTKYKKRFYKCVILPKCTYGAQIWETALKQTSILKKIRTLEQVAACNIVHCQKRPKYKDVVWLSEITPIAQYVKDRGKVLKKLALWQMTKGQIKRQLKDEQIKTRREWYKNKESANTKHYFQDKDKITTKSWRTFKSTSFILNTGIFVMNKDDMHVLRRES